MANKPPAVKITGIRGSIPPGYLLGRVDPGHGDVQLISMAKAQSAGLIPASLPGPPTGAAGGDLSGTYPNPTVAKLQGRAVSAGAPASTNVLAWGGASWAPLALAAVAYSGAYSDLSGLPTIHNVPAGGTAGQALTKVDGTDYNLAWSTISAGSGGGAASIYDDGSNLYVALSDTDGQLVLDGSGDPVFSLEVLPVAAIPALSYDAAGAAAAALVSARTGVTDGSNAAAGQVGELLKTVIPFASAVLPSANVGLNIASLVLTPGDWDVSGVAAFFSSTVSATSVAFGISTTTGTLPSVTADAQGNTEISVALTSGASNVLGIPPMQFNVTVNTTIYLVINGAWTGAGTPKAWGTLRARRVR